MFSVDKAVNPDDRYWRMTPVLFVSCKSGAGIDANVAIELAGIKALLLDDSNLSKQLLTE